VDLEYGAGRLVIAPAAKGTLYQTSLRSMRVFSGQP
jgi:hypothetical protein